MSEKHEVCCAGGCGNVLEDAEGNPKAQAYLDRTPTSGGSMTPTQQQREGR